MYATIISQLISFCVSDPILQNACLVLYLEACPDLCVHVWEVGVGGVVAAVTQPWQVNTLDKWDDLNMSHYPHYILVLFWHSPTLQYCFTLASSRWMFAKVKCFTFRSSLLRLSLSIIQCSGDSTILNKTKYFRLRLSDEVSTERPETDLRLPWDCHETDPWDWPETDLRLTWDWPEVILKNLMPKDEE